MPSDGAVPVAGPRLPRLYAWFDPESAAVVTILLGLFQVVLSGPLAYVDNSLPKLFILPLAIGILIVAGGSLTMANERNPSRQLLQGSACSNMAGLLGTLLASCLYCYNLNTANSDQPCEPASVYHIHSSDYVCPRDLMQAYCWSMTLLLLLYAMGAMVLQCLLSVSAFKALKTNSY